MSEYPKVQLHIAGQWRDAEAGRSIDVLNPASEEVIGTVAHASRADLDAALASAERGFAQWRKVSPFERSKVLRRAADIMRGRADAIARIMTMEQGKPVAEAKMEVLAGCDIIDWFAEEARRTYGQVIPARAEGVYQLAIKEPVGVVAAFTPWNFPINQVVRKASMALAAGCSIICKPPEETPASPVELLKCYLDAGVPGDVINIVFGTPSEISGYLIPHPVVKKVTFTGSTVIGKHLAALAGQHMKRVTMELGGHAPAMVFDDADVDAAAKILAMAKFRNAGQVCVSPTRFLVQEKVYDRFVASFVSHAKTLKVGDGLAADTTMGPLANERRIPVLETMVADARTKGAEVVTGGNRIGNKGYFYEPTVVAGASTELLGMNEEPFGPIAFMRPFKDLDEVVAEANRLPYGLASYAFTSSGKTAARLAAGVEVGMMTINHLGLALPEVPFGGVKDSGYGTEGGSEAIEAYLNTKFVSQAGL